jgi:integrase
LAQARAERDNARALIAQDIDPMTQRKAEKAAKLIACANSFDAVAAEWLAKRGPKSESGDARLKRILEKDLSPAIGSRPISEITPPELLSALRKIETRGAFETAKKAKQTAGQIFRFAVASGLAERDPSADLKGALQQGKVKHYAAITEPKEVGRLMAAIHSYQATPAVMAAIKLAPLFFCRPGELRQLEWSEVNFEERRIDIPAEKMKLAEPHIIPLADQALAILKEQHKISSNSRYVFPNARALSRPLSDNGMRIALRTMGYTNEQMTPHGFRAMARTLLDEVLGFPVDWIEHQLAHAVRDTNGRAYNRTKHLESRKKMMQAWADYLDTLRLEINNVVPIKIAKR